MNTDEPQSLAQLRLAQNEENNLEDFYFPSHSLNLLSRSLKILCRQIDY